MKLWLRLYTLVRIALVEFLLVMVGWAFPATRIVLVPLHVGLGLGMIWFAYGNFTLLVATTVPGRVKRIAKAAYQFAIASAVIGFLMAGFQLVNVQNALPILFGITPYNVIQFFHVVVAFAIITKAASTATGYDMWEERDWEKETRPGEVPPSPMAAAAAPKA